MIKKVAIFTISFYQATAVPLLKSLLGVKELCRFEESCSVYAKRVISEKGALRGSALSFARILKCQPFYSGNLSKGAIK